MNIPRVPEGVELLTDVSPGRWIEQLWPWGPNIQPPGVPVGSLLPEGFDRYCRVLHPASLEPGHEPVQWATVASWTGRTVHPLMQFCRVANLSEPHRQPAWGSLPLTGSLPREEFLILSDLLRGFTTTPGEYYFAVWEGYGHLDPNLYRNIPRLRSPEKSYLLFRGSLEAVLTFLELPGWWHSLNIWWPADRAWSVNSEIDLFDTYVGGSKECIDRILKHPELETFPTTIDARVDVGADTINIGG